MTKALRPLILAHLAFCALAVGIFWIAPAHASVIDDLATLLGAPVEDARLHRSPGARYNMRSLDGYAPVRASYYGGGPKKYEPNSHTANGEYFNQWGLAAAHRSYPFGTRLSVCFRGCVTVRVNDRGPATWTGRSLDLSRGAAARIGLLGPGVATVRVARIGG